MNRILMAVSLIGLVNTAHAGCYIFEPAKSAVAILVTDSAALCTAAAASPDLVVKETPSDKGMVFNPEDVKLVDNEVMKRMFRTIEDTPLPLPSK